MGNAWQIMADAFSEPEPFFELYILVVGDHSKFSQHLTHLGNKSHKVGGKNVKPIIILRGSEEGLATLNPSYYRGISGIIIAYDFTDQASFDHGKRWLEKINRHGPADICKLLVGAKGSMNDRIIDYNTGKTYADQMEIPFAEIPEIIPENIKEVFEKMVDDVLWKFQSRQREQREKEEQILMQQQKKEDSGKESNERKI